MNINKMLMNLLKICLMVKCLNEESYCFEGN